MNILAKLVTAFRNWPVAMHFSNPALDLDGPRDWQEAEFFNEHRAKTEKLASLARYIENARAVMTKRKAQKKRSSDIEAAIRAAQRERLEIETGKRVLRDRVWVVAE